MGESIQSFDDNLSEPPTQSDWKGDQNIIIHNPKHECKNCATCFTLPPGRVGRKERTAGEGLSALHEALPENSQARFRPSQRVA